VADRNEIFQNTWQKLHFLELTKNNVIVEYLDYQIPVYQLKGPRGDEDVQAAKRDWNAPPTRDLRRNAKANG